MQAHETLESVLEEEHQKEDLEHEMEDGLDVDVLAMTAATQVCPGVKFLPMSVLERWGQSARQVQHSSAAETKFGRLSVWRWEACPDPTDLGSRSDDLPYLTSWVVDSTGVVLAGHHCCRKEVSKPSKLCWSLESVNWNNHRDLVTRVCNSLWQTKDVGKLPLRFRRLLHLIGIPDRVQAWNDGDGIQALGCRKSLRDHHVLVCFRENAEGHWDEFQLSKKIKIQEAGVVKTLAFVGHTDRGPRSVLSS